MLHKTEPSTENELREFKFIIQRNVYSYLAILLEGRQQFEWEMFNQPNISDMSMSKPKKRSDQVFLPNDIMAEIFSWLNKHDLKNCKLSSNDMYNTIQTNSEFKKVYPIRGGIWTNNLANSLLANRIKRNAEGLLRKLIEFEWR